MRVLLSLVALVLALPVGLFAGGILVLDHVIEVRNPFRLFWEFLLAFGWGLPIAALIFVLLVAATFFRTGQVVVAGALVVANAAALMVVFRSAARPTAVGDVAVLIPAFLSLAIAGYLLWSHGQAARIASPAAPAVAAGPARPAR